MLRKWMFSPGKYFTLCLRIRLRLALHTSFGKSKTRIGSEATKVLLDLHIRKYLTLM